MNINPISSGNPMISKSSLGANEDPQIKNLEQKLSQLNKEKEKAEKAKDSERVREIQQKIQEIERRLEELKKKKSEKGNEAGKEASLSQPRLPKSNAGNYVDESV